MDKPQKVVIDIDGTICDELPTFEKSMAKPKSGAIECINKLYDKGAFIIFYTARGWAEFKMTENWLKSHGFRYHTLICGKPVYDLWIDDRAIQFNDWASVASKLNIEMSKEDDSATRSHYI